MDIIFKSDNLVALLGPMDVALGTTLATGTCVFLLFDNNKDSRLRTDRSSTDTLISVTDVVNYRVGDELYVELNDGTFDTLTIVDIDAPQGNIVVAEGGLTSAASKNNRVSVFLGAKTGLIADAVTMATFGTPVANTFDWGYRGVLPDTHTGLNVGQNIRIEITLDAAAGLKLIKNLYANVVGGT